MSVGGEYIHPAELLGIQGDAYLHAESTTRSKTFGDPSDSVYTVINGYSVINASLGFRQAGSWEFFVWAKNLLNQNYMQNLTIQAGNSGLIAGTPDDPRMVRVTLRGKF